MGGHRYGQVVGSSSDAGLSALLTIAHEQSAVLHLVPPSGTTYVLSASPA